METYSEKEYTEEGKRQDVQLDEKRSTKTSIGTKSPVQGDKKLNEKSVAKWINGSSGLRARIHTHKLPNYGKELKKNFNH